MNLLLVAVIAVAAIVSTCLVFWVLAWRAPLCDRLQPEPALPQQRQPSEDVWPDGVTALREVYVERPDGERIAG